MQKSTTMRTGRSPAEAGPAPIGALARLPVFLDLRGKPVVVAGTGNGAGWKADLVRAAGAELRRIERMPEAADLDGAVLLIADAPDDAVAARVHALAKSTGVPCNIIDRPAHCDLAFGSIVNRGPVVVGISTAGAAPVLGQAIRRRIETLLAPTLADWAALALRLRDRLASALPDAAARRAAWSRFAEMALTARGAAPDADSLLDRLVRGGDGSSGGRVTLVGAGPGDAELLTLKAVRALQSADVILFDDLVSPDVLELARREAKRMLVGKRGGRESCRQDDINALMLRLARQGRHVVRLKSGDPMIFGRAGEEIAVLQAAGIPVEVVPGISAGIAAASRLGVSLTHRDAAQSVRFVTGHARSGDLPDDLDWQGLADPATTLVVYMGGRTAARFAARLLAHGLDPATPVRTIAAVSRPGERVERMDLATLATITVDATDPVLVMIGRALALESQVTVAVDRPGALTA
ncbi:MAG: siroheme synthase CysG [Pseudomonadota bacterium]|nr:siroheme synthase CysG [Pseudomonadota bacterium]